MSTDMQFEFVQQIIGHSLLVQNLTPVDEMLSKIQFNPSPMGYKRFFKCLSNLSLCSKIIENCHFVQIFTPVVVNMLSKIQSSPSPEGYGRFSNV